VRRPWTTGRSTPDPARHKASVTFYCALQQKAYLLASRPSGRSAGVQAVRKLHDTITRLAALKRRVQVSNFEDHGSHLQEMVGFGSNPGKLKARIYLPQSLTAGAPLVVVLHGCTQSPAGYDAGSGWSKLADEQGFALLFPEQQRSNNPNLCFKWFSPDDTARDGGEALSIRQMVAAMHERCATDPRRTFVTGLSAGGAMTAVMLAAYPDVFAGGGVIAGLPFGTARSVPEAFDRMRAHGGGGPEQLAALVRAASSHSGPWPTLSVWHGSSDATVDPSNAAALIGQWRILHGSGPAPCRTDTVHGYPHRVWCGPDGEAAVEEYVITGMAHGTPLSTSGEGSGEVAGPYMLEAGISSTRLIARFWGLIQQADQPAVAAAAERGAPRPRAERRMPVPEPAPASARSPVVPSGVQATIENALRSAGLMR
jgi:poly(hydroxyalkanoate) depolymerase family esterase